MAKPDLSDLPDVPPEPEPAFLASNSTGGYLAGNDDAEIRKIRRKTSPVGRLLILSALVLGGGTAFYMVRSAREEAAENASQQEARRQLEQLLEQNLPREQLATRVREIYEQHKRSEEARMSARRLLASMHDTQSVSIFIEGLSGHPRERRQAALGLAEIGLPAAASARDALVAALPRTDPLVDRVEVAWALVVLEEPRAWDQIVALLGEGKLQTVKNLDDPPRSIFDAGLVARMAGPERLRRLAEDSRVPLRRIAAVSLSEVASPELFDVLSRLAADSDADVAREAAIGLGRTGDNRAGEPVVRFLNAHPDARDGVLNALQRFSGSPGLSVVMQNATDTATRSQASRLLRELQDPGAGDAFVALMNSIPENTTDAALATVRKNAIFGLADIGDPRSAAGLLYLAQLPIAPNARPDPNMDQDARLALDALRKIPGAAANARAQLVTLAGQQNAMFMRTPVLIALGATGDVSLGPTIMAHLADENSQEGAAIALCRLRYPAGVARVRADMRRPPTAHMNEETVRDEPLFVKRRNAIRAIAWTRDASIAPDLMRIIEDPLDRRALREEAGFSLASIADDALITQISAKATDTALPEEVRRFYLFALRGRSSPQVANRLVELYLRPGVDSETMRAAAIAAGFGGDPSTAEAVRPLLTSNDSTVQLAAGITAILAGDNAIAPALLDAMTADEEFVNLLSSTFVLRGSQAGGAGNNSATIEPPDLLPLTESMFTEGRIARRINLAALLERGRGTHHYEFATQWLKTRLRAGWEHPLGIGPYAVRAKLREMAQNTANESGVDAAFTYFRAMGDRGSLLYLRRQTGPAAERARRVLVEMNAQQ